jgi:hypothetical protein
MAQISGIQFEKNTKGENTYVRINLKKFGDQLQPFLEQIGIKKEEDEFDNEWKDAISGEEARVESKKRISSWWKK